MSEREDKEVEKVKKCLNWFAKNIPKAAPDLLALAGGYLIAQGAWMIYPPAGMIVGGLIVIAAAVIVGRAGESG